MVLNNTDENGDNEIDTQHDTVSRVTFILVNN